ncbi:RnfH family protein [Alcaligenes faecalis subsp. faecalis]|uniref:RnfH family protein n=1 Tax=Alcaligenes faecalis TaxID=511 RepID=UPI001F3AB408|nr:RnfH family protein [Alcaligenes faecalis subsp. faecalis]
MTDLSVSVIVATQAQVWKAALRLPAGSCVRDALLKAGIAEGLRECGLPPLDDEQGLDALHVGVYGQRCQLDQLLRDQDRVEVYRELIFDPMDSRRRRYAHKLAARAAARPRRKPARA